MMLHEIATINKVKTPLANQRINRKSIASASLYIHRNSSLKEARKSIQTKLTTLELQHPDIKIIERGQTHASHVAIQAIMDVVPWVIFILITLLLLREWSFKHVFIILCVLPFSYAGANLGLLICGQSQGFMSLVGTVSLFGIVINNVILWLDAVQNQHEPENRFINATTERFRAITVTSLCGVTTLLPLYWFGGEIWKPLAATLIFGLTLSYFTIILLLPVTGQSLLKNPYSYKVF